MVYCMLPLDVVLKWVVLKCFGFSVVRNISNNSRAVSVTSIILCYATHQIQLSKNKCIGKTVQFKVNFMFATIFNAFMKRRLNE